MGYLVAILVALALPAGFAALTWYEARRGARFFSDQRAALDAQAARAAFIIEHVDLAAFAREEARHAMARAGHAIAHVSLRAVRAAERFLTRLVRYMRRKKEEAVVPRENAREFVKALSDFKETIASAHPEIPDMTDSE